MERTNTVLTIPRPGDVKLIEKTYPTITTGYALVKVAIAPICIEHQIYRDHTFEWHEDEEHLGHEGVGTIVEVAPGSEFEDGDRVIIYQGHGCDDCFVCRNGLSPTHCMGIPYEEIQLGGDPHATLEALGGGDAMSAPGGMKSIEIACGSESGGFGFATYRIAPERMIQKIPDDLDFRYAAAANCSCGCSYTGVEETGVGDGDWAMVAGIGFVGFGAIINAKYRGAKVIALGRNEYRMNLAREMGADVLLNPEDPDWLHKVRELTGDRKGVDAVFECSGYPFYQTRSLQAVRRYGTVFCFGFLPDSDERLPIHILDDIMNRRVHLTGGHDVNFSYREGLLKMLSDRGVQRSIDLMVTHEFNMSDGAAAFEAALSKKAGKI
jgi:threonine dehydrogenase-like Zn-dependent dehydrogenase